MCGGIYLIMGNMISSLYFASVLSQLFDNIGSKYFHSFTGQEIEVE